LALAPLRGWRALSRSPRRIFNPPRPIFDKLMASLAAGLHAHAGPWAWHPDPRNVPRI
jgi:hypothetical protein